MDEPTDHAEHPQQQGDAQQPDAPAAPEPEQVVVLAGERSAVRPVPRWAALARRPGVAAAAGATATLGVGVAVSVARQVLAHGGGRRALPAAVEVSGRIVHHVVHHHVVHHRVVERVQVVQQVLPPRP